MKNELKFLVPASARTMVTAELTRSAASAERLSLLAMYLDTSDRRLARAGLSLCMRREGQRWIQSLEAAEDSLSRFEDEVIRVDATHDASQHAGTDAGDKLLALLRGADDEGQSLRVHFLARTRRTARRVRTRRTVVDVAFDEGRLLAGGSTLRFRDLRFRLASGEPQEMLALAERWRKRLGLVLDLRSTAERGDLLAQGLAWPALRKAARPSYPDKAAALEALAAVLDECLGQICRNAVGLIEGDPRLRVEHVHQMRVGIRRLRSALRSFKGWTPSPPPELVSGLRAVFDALGTTRDSDVMDAGVVAELAMSGAPPLELPAAVSGRDPAEVASAPDTQRNLLAWIVWRAGLGQAASAGDDSSRMDLVPGQQQLPSAGAPAVLNAGTGPSLGSEASLAEQGYGAAVEATAGASGFRRDIQRRLRRWHQGIVAEAKQFESLDEEALHALRKRIKRQRYAVEFFAPVLRKRERERYLAALGAMQERMGALNDLFVARVRYQTVLASDPAAWYALGWIAARIAEARSLAKPLLRRLANLPSPGIRGGHGRVSSRAGRGAAAVQSK